MVVRIASNGAVTVNLSMTNQLFYEFDKVLPFRKVLRTREATFQCIVFPEGWDRSARAIEWQPRNKRLPYPEQHERGNHEMKWSLLSGVSVGTRVRIAKLLLPDPRDEEKRSREMKARPLPKGYHVVKLAPSAGSKVQTMLQCYCF